MNRTGFLHLFLLFVSTSCMPCYIDQCPVMSWCDFEEPPQVQTSCEEVEIPSLHPELFNPYQPLEEACQLSAGDVLNIAIFGDDETACELVIAPDGRLYYTFLDGIPAAGRALTDVRKEMEASLSHFFVHPKLLIVPKHIGSQSYKIIGGILQPGVYPIRGSVHLREAIDEAGGLRKDRAANLKNSFLSRKGEKLSVNFEQLLDHADNRRRISICIPVTTSTSLISKRAIFLAMPNQSAISSLEKKSKSLQSPAMLRPPIEFLKRCEKTVIPKTKQNLNSIACERRPAHSFCLRRALI